MTEKDYYLLRRLYIEHRDLLVEKGVILHLFYGEDNTYTLEAVDKYQWRCLYRVINKSALDLVPHIQRIIDWTLGEYTYSRWQNRLSIRRSLYKKPT